MSTLRSNLKHPLWRMVLALVGAGILVFSLAACGEAETPAPTEEIQPVVQAPTEKPTEPPAPEPTDVPAEPEPEPTEPPDQSAQLAAWETGAHGKTYDLGKGPNTFCSRCHSPQNWDPASFVGPAPNCVTCKFPTDPELRQSNTMDFVEEADWKGISCETCHQVVDGIVQPGFAWLNTITMEYEEVNTSNELCGKCHATTQGIRATGGRGVDHAINLGGSAHLNWAGMLPQGHRPSYCTDCHDPHSGVPKQCTDCHSDVLESDTHIKGQNAAHTNVDCLACHDASGMDVGPDPSVETGGKFVTILTEVSRSGETTSTYLKSHSIQWEVSCDRCHFEGNPWELTVRTATGELPEEEE